MNDNVQPTQEELLNATTPEALAELMAKAGGAEQGVTTPEPETPAVDAAPAPAPAADGATPGASQEQPPHGIATKSGQGVLPYRVLEEARERASTFRTRAEEAERARDEALQRLTNLQGKAVPDELLSVARDLTDGEIQDLEYLNPKAAKAVRLARSLAAQPEPQAPAAAPAAPAEPTQAQQEAVDEVTAALNGRKLLQSVGASGGPLWARAVDLDAALKVDAQWATRPMSERFKEVERRLANELGVRLADDPHSAPQPTAAAAPAPQPAAPAPTQFRPNTLSDLQGGAAPSGDGISEEASGIALAARFSNFTDGQLAAVIRRAAGA